MALDTSECRPHGETLTGIASLPNRRPFVGLAVGVVRDGNLEFHGHGLADVATNDPVTRDTVFRVGSLTKTFTAIAVLQLCERGLIDLDAPAAEYLRAYELVSARPWHRPPTVRHLLTHTAGLPELVYPTRVLRPILGETVPFGRRVPTLAEFYRGRLRLVAEPGVVHTYSNHGFATLGQIVEDTARQPLADYLRDRILGPLGMADTDLVRSDRVAARLATGYALRSTGPRPVADRDIVTIGAGALYSTTADLARYVAALLGGSGSVLRPETLATLFAPQYRPDPRVPGVGLAFFRGDLGGHPVVEHEGLVPGFNSQLTMAPADGVGVIALTNGARGAHWWLGAEVSSLLQEIIGVPADTVRGDVPHHPEIWAALRGWYSFRGSWRDVQKWFVAGAEVSVRRGRLVVRPLTPVPALSRSLTLCPDDDRDPYVFRVRVPSLGAGTTRVVFSRSPAGRVTAFHLEIAGLSFDKRGG